MREIALDYYAKSNGFYHVAPGEEMPKGIDRLVLSRGKERIKAWSTQDISGNWKHNGVTVTFSRKRGREFVAYVPAEKRARLHIERRIPKKVAPTPRPSAPESKPKNQRPHTFAELTNRQKRYVVEYVNYRAQRQHSQQWLPGKERPQDPVPVETLRPGHRLTRADLCCVLYANNSAAFYALAKKLPLGRYACKIKLLNLVSIKNSIWLQKRVLEHFGWEE